MIPSGLLQATGSFAQGYPICQADNSTVNGADNLYGTGNENLQTQSAASQPYNIKHYISYNDYRTSDIAQIYNNQGTIDFYLNQNASATTSQLEWTIAGTAGVATTYLSSITDIAVHILTERERKRQELKKKLLPQIRFNRFGVARDPKASELRAREALKSLVGDEKFRKYLKNGFLMIKGDSGKIYQIFPGHAMTNVWLKGNPVEKLCLVPVDSSLPPTDAVIMRTLVILDSEEEFRKKSRIHQFNRNYDNDLGNYIVAPSNIEIAQNPVVRAVA